MAERTRITVQVAESGRNAIDQIGAETGSNRSEVTREALLMVVATPANRAELTKRLKARKEIG